MKLKTLAVIAVLGLICTMLPSAYGQQKQWVEDFTVGVGTTTAVLAGGAVPTRKYYAVGNWSPTYIVFHATWAIAQADIQSILSLTAGQSKKGSGIPLAPYQNGSDLNKWVDEYNIYPSSWYVLVSSAGQCSPTEAPIVVPVTYRQRK
jgi:hypothetical protein